MLVVEFMIDDCGRGRANVRLAGYTPPEHAGGRIHSRGLLKWEGLMLCCHTNRQVAYILNISNLTNEIGLQCKGLGNVFVFTNLLFVKNPNFAVCLSPLSTEYVR